MMLMNKLPWTAVGADVSAIGGFHAIPLNLFITIIGPY